MFEKASVFEKSLIGIFVIRAAGYFPLCGGRFVLKRTLAFVHEASMSQLGVFCVSFPQSCDREPLPQDPQLGVVCVPFTRPWDRKHFPRMTDQLGVVLPQALDPKPNWVKRHPQEKLGNSLSCCLFWIPSLEIGPSPSRGSSVGPGRNPLCTSGSCFGV